MPLFAVLHNADVDKESYIASYVGLEADGTYLGYGGCDVPTPIGSSSWVSTAENRGPLLRGDLCPEGKHGYDPRYVSGLHASYFCLCNSLSHLVQSLNYSFSSCDADAVHGTTQERIWR